MPNRPASREGGVEGALEELRILAPDISPVREALAHLHAEIEQRDEALREAADGGLLLASLLKMAGEDDEQCHEYLDRLGAAKYDGEERMAPHERLMSLVARPHLRFYCHAGLPGCFCAYRRADHMHREDEHRHYAALEGWFSAAPPRQEPARRIVGTPGVVVCIDHRPAAMCHRDHATGECICRPPRQEPAPAGEAERDPRRFPVDPHECQEGC
jgi:hypothetical protein